VITVCIRLSYRSFRARQKCGNAFEMEAYYMWERVHLTEDMSRSCSSCDCVTYSYFLISVFLFTLGSIISVFSFGAFDDTVFANLGHMWMVGPLCICSAVMIGIRNVIYLRRRRVIDMVIRQQIEVRTTAVCYCLPILFYFCAPPGHKISTGAVVRHSTTVFVTNTHGEWTHLATILWTVDW